MVLLDQELGVDGLQRLGVDLFLALFVDGVRVL